MRDIIKNSVVAIIALLMATSCDKEDNKVDFTLGKYSIKSIVADGKTVEKFIYSTDGKIVENQGFYFCSRYTYSEDGRLIKREIAVDKEIASSSVPIQKSKLMTSANSTFTGYSIFEYDTEGQLITLKNYSIKNGQFEFTSMNTLDYDGDKIVRRNLYNDKNELTQFSTYEYDDNGNVAIEKYYSCLSSVDSAPQLVNEESFKYDNKNNPFVIYKQLGDPGPYSNKNNIVEINSVLFMDVQGVDKSSTSQTSYKYNEKNFPIKVNNTEEYKYE